MKRLYPLLLPLLLWGGCGFDEGLNEIDLTGYIVIPEGLGLSMNDVGVIYIGIYSGWDETLGYPHPSTSPVIGSGTIGDALPFAGTSIGTFGFEDTSTKCSIVEREDETLYLNEGGDIEGGFLIYRAPMVDGAIIYAFADNDNTSCNPDDGYYHYGEEGGSGYYEGTNYPDVLNYPSKYITKGDIITSLPEEVSWEGDNIVYLDFVME